ncbi:MAG: hypothetical protein GF315_08575, partial [candidate division Zixibacteria bacterium]|nr:hypothetical protein [candidate division Zixibacteria bacterium]
MKIINLLLIFCCIVIMPSAYSAAKPVVAVMDFIPKGVTDIEASALTDRLRNEMVQSCKCDIV